MNARDELARIIWDGAVADRVKEGKDPKQVPVVRPKVEALADAILVAGYRKPRTVASMGELQTLPVGTVVLAETYKHHSAGTPVSFQKWPGGAWHRGGRSSDTHPDNFLPATVLWEPQP